MFTRGAVKDITVLVLILPPFLPEVGVDLFFVSFPTQGAWVGWDGQVLFSYSCMSPKIDVNTISNQ